MIRRRQPGLAWSSLVSMVLAAAALAHPRAHAAGPEARVADNVFVVPDKHARSVSGWLVVLAGCADEADGRCVGIAHYLEHLLFINRDSDNKSKVSMFADGGGNGWTSHRATTYFQRFPANAGTDAQNLDKLIGYFAGLLSEVRTTGQQAERERNVVMQEYQQNTGRNPFARLTVALSEALMPGDPLGQRVIGSPSTISAFTEETARAFHQRWYARNNAYVVVHGPIEAKAVAALVARHFAPLPEKPVPAHAWKAGRDYGVGTQVIRSIDKDARQVAVFLDRIVTFEETVGTRDDNDAAGSVLSAFLASRLAGSPLETLMERDGLVTEARFGISRVRDGAARLSFSAVPARGVHPDAVLEAARAYLRELNRVGLGQEVVDRLKMRIRNERALLAEQPGSYAGALSAWLAGHGSYESWAGRAAALGKVTPASVDRILSLVAGPAREVVGTLLPAGAVAAAGREPLPGLPTPAAETAPQLSGAR